MPSAVEFRNHLTERIDRSRLRRRRPCQHWPAVPPGFSSSLRKSGLRSLVLACSRRSQPPRRRFVISSALTALRRFFTLGNRRSGRCSPLLTASPRPAPRFSSVSVSAATTMICSLVPGLSLVPGKACGSSWTPHVVHIPEGRGGVGIKENSAGFSRQACGLDRVGLLRVIFQQTIKEAHVDRN